MHALNTEHEGWRLQSPVPLVRSLPRLPLPQTPFFSPPTSSSSPRHRTYLRRLPVFCVHDEVPLPVDLRRDLEQVQEEAQLSAVSGPAISQEPGSIRFDSIRFDWLATGTGVTSNICFPLTVKTSSHPLRLLLWLYLERVNSLSVD